MEINEQELKERVGQSVHSDIIIKKMDELPEMSLMQMLKLGIDVHEEILKVDLPKKSIKEMKQALKELKKLKVAIGNGHKPTQGGIGGIALMVCTGLWLVEGE